MAKRTDLTTPSRLARWSPRVLIALAVVGAGACAHGANLTRDSAPLQNLTKQGRQSTIARAQVWTATDVSAMDLRVGPKESGAFPPFAAVTCTYVERKMTGKSPKFTCELAPGDEVKVKYGADNPEVYGVVAASRLLWALGFGADRWYPVRVTCHGCPTDPRRDSRPASGEVTFAMAAIERKMPGKTMETRSDEGWNWSELDLVDENGEGAPRAQRDALKLLAAMIQHGDNKPQQQRLICLPDESDLADSPICAAPFMMAHDVGLTFGEATWSHGRDGVNFAGWSKKPVWQNERRCVAQLSESWTGTMGDPIISEAGRTFLAGLLVQLSDTQLRDLFEVARFPQHSHASVEDWIAAFKKKRADIAGASCPS